MAERRYAFADFFHKPPGADAFRHTPHAHALGMQLLEMGPGLAVVSMPYRPEIVGDPSRGVVFGGAITALIDQASGVSVGCAMEEFDSIATIDLRIDYLRAAEPGCDLFARSECYKITRRVAFVRTVAYERTPDDPFASGHGAFMVGANRAGFPYPRDRKKEA